MNNQENDKINHKDIEQLISTLNRLNENGALLYSITKEKRIEILKAAGALTRPNRKEIKKRNRAINKTIKNKNSQNDRKARASTGIRAAREESIFTAPNQIADNTTATKTTDHLDSPRNCYVCKKSFTELHHFYDSMCPKCAEYNYQKRFQTADLTGQVALITGSRLKIGYHATLMMLRAGASVIATTRFPVDSAKRYAKEKDFENWKERLHIYGLDLRHTPSVEIFTGFIEKKYNRLDILINNAAQTVRRPPGFYKHLISDEILDYNSFDDNIKLLLKEHQNCINQLESLPNKEQTDGNTTLPGNLSEKIPGTGIHSSAKLSQIPYTHDEGLSVKNVFPEGKLDVDLQQVDLRETNSWRLKIGEIQTSEMIELQLINAIAPFVLCNKLIPLMMKENSGQKHIVNVSAMEGKFFKFFKDSRHPHTNMAKAALNMLTHTSADELAKHGIYINAVDTGWVTDEDPINLVKYKIEKHDFQPPLDIVDGAARVCDPFFNGINTGKHWSGKFLKDYFPIDW